MNINQILSILFASVPFIIMCLLYTKTNLKKENRGFQFASVIYGVLFSIIAVIGSDNLSDKILKFIKSISQQLAVTAEQKPEYSDICQRIISFIDSVDWEFYMIFIINFLMLTIFMISKRILLPIFKSIWKNETLFNSTSGICYEWSDYRRAYVLKAKFYSLKILMSVYFGLVIIITAVLLVLCKLYPDWHGFLAVFYPFALVIILGEIVFFLGGKTDAEFADDIGGEGGSSFKVVNYYRLRKYLSTVFGDRIISQNTELPKYYNAHNNSEIVKKFENIDKQEARIANLYFKRKSDSGVQLDENLVEATYRLMNGESVLFANPFYTDYSDYIFLPLNRAATKGNKILFILGRNGIEDDVINWINKSFADVICVENMWSVGKLNSSSPFDGEVGVVSSSDIFNNEIVSENLSFLSAVTEVVLIEPSQFVSTSQMSIALYISKVRPNATYYVIDKNNDGLIDTISHIIRTSIKEVSATNKEHNRFSYVLWKADGNQLSHRIFPNVARYLGVGTELMIAGIRNQINLTEWYSYSKFPVIDMKWISEQYYSPLCKYASLNPKQEEISKRMKFKNNLWSVEKSDHKYIVVEDEFCNMFEMARQFSTRGKEESFINVISQNYLLRDYMQDNHDLFVSDPKAIPSFCPDYARTERNIVIELLLKLSVSPITKTDLLNFLRYIGSIDVNNIHSKYELKCIIFNLVNKYFQNECAKYIVTETTLIEEQNDLFFINNKDFVKEATNALKCAYYVLEDERSEQYYLDAKLLGHVFQSHLPGQHIVLNGKYYEILFIEGEKGVVVKRAADSIASREYYRQLRNYKINDFVVEDVIGGQKSIGSIVVERGMSSFSVSTNGYLLMQDYGDVCNSLKREISNIPDRNYTQKVALKIKFPGTTQKIRATICVVLNEIFKTVYPDNCDFICAVTNLSDKEDIPEGILYNAEFCIKDDDSIFILEDSILDLGLISSIERNLKRFLEIVTDYLKWYEGSLLPIPVRKQSVKLPDDKLIEQVKNSNPPEKKKKKKISEFIKNLFKKKKKKVKHPTDPETEDTTDSENSPEPEEITDSENNPETEDTSNSDKDLEKEDALNIDKNSEKSEDDSELSDNSKTSQEFVENANENDQKKDEEMNADE